MNVFSSLRDFFDPDQHPPTPLVLLPASLNPFASEGVKIYAKLAFMSPTLNLKWTPAFEMLQGMESKDLVEASSGNMALALALQRHAFGISEVTALVPPDIAYVKKELLRLVGAKLVVWDAASPSAIARAKELETSDTINLNQYGNAANPEAHAKWTAREVLEQTDGAVTAFCASMGTTGTIVGARDFFDENAPSVQIVGCRCAPGSSIPGVRSEQRLSEIKLNWRKGIHNFDVTECESYQTSLDLIRSGILAGPSSGAALAGLKQYLTKYRGYREHLNKSGEIVAVFVCGDTPHLYVDKYAAVLGDCYDASLPLS